MTYDIAIQRAKGLYSEDKDKGLKAFLQGQKQKLNEDIDKALSEDIAGQDVEGLINKLNVINDIEGGII